jgi:DNA-binding NarL/FixJ family response regulator
VSLRYRRMKKEDFQDCAATIINHPGYGPPYGSDSELIVKAWELLEGMDSFHAVVFEEVIDDQVRILSPGVYVVVTDEFTREMKTAPMFWNGPELARRITSGRSPLLTNEQLRRANSTSGINLMAWPIGPPVQDQGRMNVNVMVMATFVEEVRGFNMKELYFQTPVAQEAAAVLQWGAEAITENGPQTALSYEEIQEMVKKPYEMVMNAELAASRTGSWASGLFISPVPKIGFTRGEQRLLEIALGGSTDEESTKELEISLSAVKKTWRSVYEKVEKSRVGILPTNSDDSENGDRGKGKKHRLLAYIREHREELRPFSAKFHNQFLAQQLAGRGTVEGTTSKGSVGRPKPAPSSQDFEPEKRMKLRRRPMQLADVEPCLELIAAHPDFAIQYGSPTKQLKKVLEYLLGSDGFLARVFEEILGDESRLLGLGGIAFLSDDFVIKAKKAPHFWLAPKLMSELLRDERPILSDHEVKIENSGEGLTVFAWPLGFGTEDLSHPEFLNFLMVSFLEELRGYKIKEYWGQATEVEGARSSLNSGAILLTPKGRFYELPPKDEKELLSNPHLLVITKEHALSKIGAWSSALFTYSAPVLGFPRGEQRLLEVALRGETDEEAAAGLGISVSAVKKTWRAVYDRVERSRMGILPASQNESEDGDRGKGKKHRLLAYIREHPEELRPNSTKLLHRTPQHTQKRAG